MAFRREMHHHIRLLFLEQLIHRFPVANVFFDKTEIRFFQHSFQGAEIAGIGQFVQADDPILRMLFQFVKDKITSDKTGSAGD